jgi:hypothetical protein
MTVAERCDEIRTMAGVIRCHLMEMRGAVPADELMEAQRHLLGLTSEINQAEARQHDAPPAPDRKRLAANDTDFEP